MEMDMGMLINTCNYLNHLIDHLITSNFEISSETQIAVNGLMSKLFNLMTHSYRRQSTSNIISTGLNERGSDADQKDVFKNCNPSLFNFCQMDSTIPPTNNNFTGTKESVTHFRPSNSGEVCKDNTYNSKMQKQIDNQSLNSYEPFKKHELCTGKNSATEEFPSRNSTLDSPLSALVSDDSEVNRGVSLNVVPLKDSCTSQKQKSKENLKQMTLPSLILSSGNKKKTPAVNQKTFTQSMSSTCRDDHDCVTVSHSENKLFPGVYFTEVFIGYLNNVMLGGDKSTIGLYCRICDVVELKSWSRHKRKQYHIDKCSKLNLVQKYSCSICEIQLFGTKDLMLKYFRYHFMKVHSESTVVWAEALVDCFQNDISVSSSSSSLNAYESSHNKKFNKNQNNKKEVKQIVTTNKINTKLNPVDKCDSKADFQHDSTFDVDKEDKTRSVTGSSVEMIPSSLYPQIDALLLEMKRSFLNFSISIECGFCDLCQIGILSGFDWFDHVNMHNESKMKDCKEKTCKVCNLKIFGKSHEKYFDLPGHCYLDDIIKGKLV